MLTTWRDFYANRECTFILQLPYSSGDGTPHCVTIGHHEAERLVVRGTHTAELIAPTTDTPGVVRVTPTRPAEVLVYVEGRAAI
jgi:hypothetical protein